MSQSIINALYNGKIIPWERRKSMSAERKAIEKKIEAEKRYFSDKMSLDDCQRLNTLGDLILEAAFDEHEEIYAHGFTLGALLMIEVMEMKEAIINT